MVAAIAHVRANKTGVNAKRNNFEACVAYILPMDPNSRKRKAQNDGHTIANVSGADVSTGQKESVGSTGVEYRYYTEAEYKRLSDHQKVELKSWRQKQRNGKNNGKSKTSNEQDGPVTKGQLHSTVASVIQEQLSKRQKKQKQSDEQFNALCHALSEFSGGTSANATAAAASGASSCDERVVKFVTKLQGILSRSSGKKI